MILAIRTDKPDAELLLLGGDGLSARCEWRADRQLAETLTARIDQFLASQNVALTDLRGVAVYVGPGSFTGLRIGISVANALGAGLGVPVHALDEDTWGSSVTGHGERLVLPKYGSEPHITAPRK
ncbi:tRNA (adenosine(37)-N6)-threonylcarbamoyltransferase complex dimerization subunit type 1 TsaB [Candidatus Saccharibacteria bacterium]|nr:tRNA (adenosine(37)-N6)-threonylcarbamoyltransferase complex dimerization subunit type 1 TsaB [Candidatus Saccharibacteria bacterium]